MDNKYCFTYSMVAQFDYDSDSHCVMTPIITGWKKDISTPPPYSDLILIINNIKSVTKAKKAKLNFTEIKETTLFLFYFPK